MDAAPKDVRALDEEEIRNGNDVRGIPAEKREDPLCLIRTALLEKEEPLSWRKSLTPTLASTAKVSESLIDARASVGLPGAPGSPMAV